MNGLALKFCGETLTILPSGALFWAACGLLCVSDLHLGKSERMARRGGTLLPPYETMETLDRLATDIAATEPQTVLCLGDSFDDLTAAHMLPEQLSDRLRTMSAGRSWIWIEGNHDAGPVDLPGAHLREHRSGPLTFRHIAEPGAQGEVSGHYHPKARIRTKGRALSRRCVLSDAQRIILPAYGTYTGGLWCDAREITTLMAADARAVLLADRPVAVPLQALRR